MTIRVAPLAAAGLSALVGINAWLLAVVAAGIAPDDQAAVAPVDWKPNLSVSADGMAVRKPIDAYKQTLAHPVFFKSREPYVAPPPPPPPPPNVVAPPPVAVDPGLVLGGVMINRGNKKAYLFSKADPRGTWVSEGEMFLGWTIQSVDHAGARLQQQGRAIELLLYPPN
jgi:hypothetical protein